MLLTSATALVIGACSLPFGLGRASTSQLENGAADSLAKAKSFEAKGTFAQAGTSVQFDTEYVAPATEDVQVTQATLNYETLQIDGKVYYKGSEFLASQLGSSSDAQAIVKGVGTRWWTYQSAQPADLSAITNANKVRATFLTTIADKRTDDVMVDGQNTAELTLSEAILNITESSPYHLVRLRTPPGQTVSGASFDMTFNNYDKDFGIQAPTGVFDLDDPTTWPPLYQVDSFTQKTAPGSSACDDPCSLSAVVENAGGLTGAPGASTVKFTLNNQADNSLLGTCTVSISPDRPHGQKFTVGCQIQSSAWTNFAGQYAYSATADNPAYD